MKALLILTSLLLLISCGKKEPLLLNITPSLDPRLYEHRWIINDYRGIFILSFLGDTARLELTTGVNTVTTNYDLTPTGFNKAIGFDGSTESEWTYLVTESTLDMCMENACYVFYKEVFAQH